MERRPRRQLPDDFRSSQPGEDVARDPVGQDTLDHRLFRRPLEGNRLLRVPADGLDRAILEPGGVLVKSNKNDFVDAEAIAEAVERKNMRFVPIKTDDQLDLQAIHRVRHRLIARRTAVINQLRAFLLERGMVFAKTPAKLRMAMPEILENAENDLTPRMRNLLELLWDEWKMVEQQIEVLSQELKRIADTDAGCSRIQQIPGIGPIVATAIVAAIGNGAAFRKGREFAAWLGLVPRQYSTGGKARLLGISKRGSPYLRKILVHGARAAVLRIKRDQAPIGAWMDALEQRAHRNVLIVAFANKLARIAWAVLSSGEPYRPCTSAPISA
jgi:transposase